MNATEMEYAVYSHAAMLGAPSLAQREIDEYGYDSTRVLPEFTDFDVTTYQRDDGSFVLAAKGTTLNREHYRDNTQIFLNLHEARRIVSPGDEFDTFNRMVHRYNDLKKKYGDDIDVHFTGYSRGGSMALSASRRLGERATVFSPGSGVLAPVRGLACKFMPCDTSSRTVYSVEGDILSATIGSNLNEYEVHKRVKPHPTMSPHSIQQFLPSKKERQMFDDTPVLNTKNTRIKRNANLEINRQVPRGFCELYPDLCVDGKIQPGGGGPSPGATA